MGLYREVFIFRIATSPPAIFWTGHGDLSVPADAVIGVSPAIALGAGHLINLPDLTQLINGTAERMDFVLSGVSSQTIAFAQEDAAEVPGARVDIGRMDLDADYQQTGDVEWEWTGEARRLTVGSEASDEGRTRTITLTVAAGDTRRSRPPMNFFTDADQRRRSPDDAVFSHVAMINAGTARRWGPAS